MNNTGAKTVKREHYQTPVGESPFIYAGYACNNNCIFCFEKDLKFFDKGTENLKKEIKIIRKKFDFINFMGKEPTLRKDLIELINYSGKLNFDQIGITTNGRMFAYLEFTKRMLESKLNQIVLTVVGHTPDLHDGHTRAKGSFKQTLQGIKNIIKLNNKKLSLVINVMITTGNYKHLLKIISFYFKLGCREFNIGHILPYNKDINSKKYVARMKDVVPNLIKAEDKFGKNAKLLFVEYPPCVFPRKYRHLSFPCLEENTEKSRIKICNGCSYIKKCDGIPQKYLNLYGEKEFVLL